MLQEIHNTSVLLPSHANYRSATTHLSAHFPQIMTLRKLIININTIVVFVVMVVNV